MKRLILILVLVAALPFALVHGQTTRLVSQGSASPAYPYTSWSSAGHTIQAVIDACDPGDIIYVDDGTYIETVLINQDITLESWCGDPANCVISAPGGSLDATVTIADPTPGSGQITIRGFKIINGAAGLYFENLMSCGAFCPVITGCIFEGHTGAAFWAHSARFTLEYCTFVDCGTGAFADSTHTNSVVQRNIFANCTNYGLRVNASGIYALNNCYFNNGTHIFGATVSICDEWSGLPSQPGVDPQFVDYAGGDYHLQPTSPCVDFVNPDDPITCTMAGQYDRDESPADLGAYGGYGQAPNDPYITCSLRLPAAGSQHVPANADVSFQIGDYPAGIDLSTLQITIANHGHAPEIFTASDCTITETPFFGPPNTSCSDYGYDVLLPGAQHALFSDFAHVSVTVDVDDNSPTPNSMSHTWQFHAEDLNPPVMLTNHYPAQGGTISMYEPIEIEFSDAGIGVDHASLQLTLNGNPISLNLSQEQWSGDRVFIHSIPRLAENGSNTLQVTIADLYGNTISPAETITFTANADTDLPFVPGVTSPSVSPPYPDLCESPVPAPGETSVSANSPIEFTVQDFSTIPDLTQMVVRVQTSNGGDWYFYFRNMGTGYVFTTSGDPYCRRVRLVRPGGWGGSTTVTVTATNGTDSAASPNTMTAASYQFETGVLPIPSTTPVGIVLLLLTMGLYLHRRKK